MRRWSATPSPSSPGLVVVGDGPVYLVVDAEDDPTTQARLRALNDPSGGVAIVDPTPCLATAHDLVVDMLVALGKRFDALRREHVGVEALALLATWLEAERTEHVVLLNAHLLPAALWRQLPGLAGAAQLWLVTGPDERTGSRQGALEVVEVVEVSMVEMEATLTSKPTAPGIDAECVLPGDDFPTFRAACRRRLTASQFAAVDHHYRETFNQTREWLLRHPDLRELAEDEAASQLRRSVCASANAGETLVKLRAAQAAYFVSGFLVRLNRTRSRGRTWTATSPPDVAAEGLTRAGADRARRAAAPWNACALALWKTGSVSFGAMARLCVGDVAEDGDRVWSSELDLTVPAYGRGILRAQRLWRSRSGASKHDWLFVDDDGEHLSMVQLLHLVARERGACGLEGVGDLMTPLWNGPPSIGFGVTLVDFSAMA